MIEVSNSEEVKIVVDCMARISSSNILKQYRPHLLKSLNPKRNLVTFFGAKGRANNYKDTLNLNFRKKEVWDQLINETISFIEKY